MTTKVTITVGGHQVIVSRTPRSGGETTGEVFGVQGLEHVIWVDSETIVQVSESADLATSPVSGIKPEGSIRDVPAEELKGLTQG